MGIRSALRDWWSIGPGPRARRSQAGAVRGQARMFEAARYNRLVADILASNTSADAELRGSLRNLRDRCRKECRDNPYARQAKRTTKVNMVGPYGIRMHSTIKKLGTNDKDDRRCSIQEAEWRKWCKANTCDVSGQKSFRQFEWAIAESQPETGEIIVRIHRRPFGGGKIPLALELIEADQLDEDYTGRSDRLGYYWRFGIEVDEWGRPARYALLNKHPGDMELGYYINSPQKHSFVDAKDIIHIFFPERANQSRGIPWLTSVVLTGHNLNQYEKAHWVRKRVQAGSLGFIIPGDPEFPVGDLDEDGNPVTDGGKRVIDTEPGQWSVLMPGDTVQPPDFGPDDGMYPQVVQNLIRRYSAGYGASYETISRDYSGTSFSSVKASRIEDHDNWKTIHQHFIELFHQRVFEEWVEAAVISNVLPLKLFGDYAVRPERYNSPRWQPRTWEWVDIDKEVKRIEAERKLMLKTHAEQIEDYDGGDFTEKMATIQSENAIKIEKDLPIGPYDPVPSDPMSDNGTDSSTLPADATNQSQAG